MKSCNAIVLLAGLVSIAQAIEITNIRLDSESAERIKARIAGEDGKNINDIERRAPEPQTLVITVTLPSTARGATGANGAPAATGVPARPNPAQMSTGFFPTTLISSGAQQATKIPGLIGMPPMAGRPMPGNPMERPPIAGSPNGVLPTGAPLPVPVNGAQPTSGALIPQPIFANATGGVPATTLTTRPGAANPSNLKLANLLQAGQPPFLGTGGVAQPPAPTGEPAAINSAGLKTANLILATGGAVADNNGNQGGGNAGPTGVPPTNRLGAGERLEVGKMWLGAVLFCGFAGFVL